MTEEQHIATLEIFEDMYRANMRASLYELEQCMMAIELLKRPRGLHARMAQETLRVFMEQSLTTLEQRLVALRTRFEALPELPTKKGEEIAS